MGVSQKFIAFEVIYSLYPSCLKHLWNTSLGEIVS